MRKIPTLFVRDFAEDPSRVLPEVNPGCEWVVAGEGVATRKLDGTCCLVRDLGSRLHKRRELKRGHPEPEGWVEADADDTTGKRVGWVPVGEGPEDRYFREAFALLGRDGAVDGTYELVGPKVQGGVEGWPCHELVPHAGAERLEGVPRSFEGLRAWLADKDIEGIVWHHPDGRMAKIKLRDFGLRRPRRGA